MSDCLFCRIVSGEIPAARVAENEHCIAFRDIAPQAPVHVLVIPRQHVASLDHVADPAIFAQVMEMARDVARAEGLSAKGYRCVVNTGADGGQTVHHLHVHVLGGRPLKWPPG